MSLAGGARTAYSAAVGTGGSLAERPGRKRRQHDRQGAREARATSTGRERGPGRDTIFTGPDVQPAHAADLLISSGRCDGRIMLDTQVRLLQVFTFGTFLQLASSWGVFAPKPLSYATLPSRFNQGSTCFTSACRSTRLRATSLFEDPLTPTSTKPPLRRVAAVRRFARLPFWPIWSGVGIWVLEKLGLKDLAAVSLNH